MAYTEKEQAVLERVKNSPFPTDYQGLRDAINATIGATNARAPEVGAFHEDVELRPGLRADISVPKGNGPHPLAVYLHGGGWVAGTSKSHRKLGMQFAEAGFVTLNVDYRLAPEHPFPAGFDDSVFAVRWAYENAKRYNGDPARIVIAGDSCGANLAAAAALAIGKESNGARLSALLLLYGIYDVAAMMERGNSNMSGNAQNYLGPDFRAKLGDPQVSPLKGVKPGALPPTFIIAGTADSLVPESYAMAEALSKAEIAYELHVLEDMPHAFMQMWMLSGCVEGQRLMFNFAKRHL
jgi:acetyl esterase/lipase